MDDIALVIPQTASLSLLYKSALTHYLSNYPHILTILGKINSTRLASG